MLLVEGLLGLIAFLLGAALFSFMNVVAWRLPRGKNPLTGRSFCPQCGAALTAGDLVPVFSWLFLRGRCRHCRAPIPVRYLLVELLGGVLALGCRWRFGTAYTLGEGLFGMRWQGLLALALCGVLLSIALIDAETQLIPNRLNAAVAVLAVLYLRRGWLRQLGRSCAAYLGGLALAALPWFAYFGAHHALDAWWECYFYDNLFLYKGDGRSALTLAQHLWWAVRDDLPAVCLLAAFLLWTVLSKRHGAALAILAMAAGLAFTSLMGGYLVYYGLVLAVFAPLGLAALPQKLPAKRGVCAALSVAGIAAAAAWCLLLSPNRALRGRTAESLPQLQFAEIIRQTPNATLLNYGTLDGGFYTAAGVLPPCRYFCVTNMPLQDQWQQQWDLLDAAAVDYVVALTGDLQNDYPIYHCVASQTYNGGEGEVTWYLYAKTK